MASSLALYVILATLSPLLASFIPVIISKCSKNLPDWVPLGLLGISSGMLFAVASLDLIPEGIEISASEARVEWNSQFLVDSSYNEDIYLNHSAEEHNVRFATFGIFLGFMLMLIIEQLMSQFGAGHSHQNSPNDHDQKNHNNKILSSSFSMAALVGLGVHSFVDGVMIGGAFSASKTVGMRVGIAIILHKFPDGFMLSSILQAMKLPSAPNKRGKVFFENIGIIVIICICIMTPIGALLSFTILEGMPDVGLGFILCFGSGSFLFITCSGILPELMHQDNRILTVLSFTCGYILFVISDSLFTAH